MKYVCNNCNHESTRFFGICPICKQGTGVETQEIVSSTSQSEFRKEYQRSGKLDIRQASENIEPLKSIRDTKFQAFNRILSSANGFVQEQVILLGASPGVGKSTLCAQLAKDDTLYISSEENFNQVNSRMMRVNPQSNCDILATTFIGDVLEAIETSNKKFVIIDSLNSIEFGVGYQTTARFAADITNAIKNSGKIGIIISQVSKGGEISGMNSVIHVVDTVLHLERSEISSNILATSSKNRFGEIGSIAAFRHVESGLEEVEIDHLEIKSEIGATYTKTRFGYKQMTIAIEALVAQSSGSFGLRKSNGYNQNRLMQVIGILQYYGKIDLQTKDIYIAISNGLSTEDISIELAIANSILSSYFSKDIIAEAYGEIRLNGKVNNGHIDGNKISHISELINLYKNR